MAFFKSFQHNFPSVNISSILDSVSSRVDDLATAVSDVTYAVSDQLTEQVTTIISKVQDEEEGENAGSQEPGHTSSAQECKASGKSMWPISREPDSGTTAGDATEAEYMPSQLEWEWRDGCWRVKKTDAELAEEERRKKEEKELWEEKEQRRRERRQKQLEKKAMSQKTKEESQDGHREEETGNSGRDRKATEGGDHDVWQGAEDCDEASQPPGPEAESCLSKQKKQKEKADKVMVKSLEREGDDERQASSTVEKKKADKKKKGKGAKKSEEASDVEKKKAKGKKGKKKKKGSGG